MNAPTDMTQKKCFDHKDGNSDSHLGNSKHYEQQFIQSKADEAKN